MKLKLYYCQIIIIIVRLNFRKVNEKMNLTSTVEKLIMCTISNHEIIHFYVFDELLREGFIRKKKSCEFSQLGGGVIPKF